MQEVTPSPVPTRSGPAIVRAVVLTLSLLVLGWLAWFVLRTAEGQRLDESSMVSVVAGRETQLTVLSLLGYVSISAIVVVALVCVGLALARGQVALAVAALAVLAGANITTQVLKHGLLERIDGVVVAPNSFPSGHTTVVVAGVGALLIAAPRVLRPLVVLGGSFAVTLTGASTVVAGWHRPSDVVGSVLIALAWTAAAALVLGGPTDRARAAWISAPLGAVAAGVALVVIGVRPSYGWSGFGEAAIVLGGVALSAALGVALMQRTVPAH
ncbi:phosphatase PAP2 family protein [Aeromicrobium sp. CF4.19]|uniref:phosphatase PAP2 family protein n=1 Tax=Aeromicrobium sp. CF4.19 TaxID=3373082 RepID=UPI003EE75970